MTTLRIRDRAVHRLTRQNIKAVDRLAAVALGARLIPTSRDRLRPRVRTRHDLLVIRSRNIRQREALIPGTRRRELEALRITSRQRHLVDHDMTTLRIREG